MADLLMVINLRDTVKDLQNSAQVLQDENADLRSRLDALESRIAETPPPPPQTVAVAPSPEMQTDQQTQADGPAPTPVTAVSGDWPVQARHPYYSFWSSSSSSSDSSSSDTEDFSPVVRRRKAKTKRSGRRDNHPGSQRDVTAARQPTRGNSSADGSRKADIYIGGVMAATLPVTSGHTLQNIVSQLPSVTSASSPTMDTGSHSMWPSQPAW